MTTTEDRYEIGAEDSLICTAESIGEAMNLAEKLLKRHAEVVIFDRMARAGKPDRWICSVPDGGLMRAKCDHYKGGV